ncbi:uncharacterized protein FIBRA_02877 [Fibroporia radiculosa]|uniref:tripeptidyl-peptidase II n=1 Tax=Fibroporia radiculosa TaxID=599839 RepID=J4GN62_9APHY|nr:uncharacterized protein FIBRA_02877 [Fibroporia radiculosa]CCM00835.1 predicted protein [Fibroporia radiculosa]
MVLLLLGATHIALLSFLAYAYGNPVRYGSLNKLRRASPQTGFTLVGAAPSDTTLNIRIALAQSDSAGLDAALYDVSTPTSPNYGHHLSKEEAAAFVAPSPDTRRIVDAWLQVNNINATELTPAGDWLGFQVSVSTANELFNADYSVYTHDATGKNTIRTMLYSLPDQLQGHVAAVHPTTIFPRYRSQKSMLSTIGRRRSAQNNNATVSDSCGSDMTPACLQSLYGIPATPATQPSNMLGVTAYDDNWANAADLQTFLQDYRPDMSDTSTFTLLSIDSGTNPQDEDDAGFEATRIVIHLSQNIDIQYTVGLATNVSVVFISVGSEDDDNLGDWLDTIDYLLNEDSPPQVLTTSYGDDEAYISTEIATNLCNAYAQLGARGVSIFFASGDGGVGGAKSGQTCTDFLATFPSGCPYVTSVGGTTGVNPETGIALSSGGFSNYWATPSYQKSAVSSYLSYLGSEYDGLYNASGRGYPDVSAQANWIPIIWDQETILEDGTSCASPIWASVVALLNDELIASGKPPLGFLNPWLYSTATSALTDITSGNNPGCNTSGFSATAGWDPITGLGTPNYAGLRAAAGLPASTLSSGDSSTSAPTTNDGWGSNFWVTLVDPQTQVSFYACPASGEVSWDPPVGNFLLPPNPEGEWWEMIDEASGIPYYYHTKSGETVWERPQAFVIPLGVLQNTALGRRLSIRRNSQIDAAAPSSSTQERIPYRRSHSYMTEKETPKAIQTQGTKLQNRRSQSSTRSSPGKTGQSGVASNASTNRKSPRRPGSSSEYQNEGNSGGPLSYPRGHPLAPIPGSPYMSDASTRPASPAARKSTSTTSMHDRHGKTKEGDRPPRRSETLDELSLGRSRSKSSSYLAYRSPQPQSLNAALEMIALSSSQSSTSTSTTQEKYRASSENGHVGRSTTPSLGDATRLRISTDTRNLGINTAPSSPIWPRGKKDRNVVSLSPRRPTPASPPFGTRSVSTPMPVSLHGKVISSPIPNAEATKNLNPMLNPAAATPVPVGMYRKTTRESGASLNTGRYPVLPHELSSEIQQFSESQYAKQYFSIHRTGFLFKRKVPVAQLMSWQKIPLSSPLLMLNKSLHKDALKIFKVIQHIMGDRERDRPVGVRLNSDTSTIPVNGSTTSLKTGSSMALLEEERWLLGEGLAHGELRDEVYCQLTKQLSGNPNTESVFKGWQFLCVLLVTFPPSKDFETYLQSFLQQATSRQEGRVDVMAKYCLRRLAYISRKGPRGKAPTTAEIETASDAAFHPSIFGESLDTIFRLQERSYPHMKVPIILPFLADGILALGGTKTEGIFRVPGDSDSVSDLKLRIEKGYYSLDGVDDPHVLASLLKLWLRELCDPLVPDELYDDCITSSHDPDQCLGIIQRLPTINRRVVLFIISFLQVFLEERTQAITKMTSPNLALVMTPNLLRCNSDSMAVVFTNAQYEQTFVHNLLLHLQCSSTDPDYVPAHGQGAVPPSTPMARTSQPRRRNNY